jgi:hypothetical protein
MQNTKPPPLGYALEADVYLNLPEMLALLSKHPRMSPATRRLLESGRATFTIDGTRFLAPAQPVESGPTHTARFDIDHVSFPGGKAPCRN